MWFGAGQSQTTSSDPNSEAGAISFAPVVFATFIVPTLCLAGVVLASVIVLCGVRVMY